MSYRFYVYRSSRFARTSVAFDHFVQDRNAAMMGHASTETSVTRTDDEPQPETSMTSLAETGRCCSPGGGRGDGSPQIREQDARLVLLESALTRGLADAEAGRVCLAADVISRLEAKYLAIVASDT